MVKVLQERPACSNSDIESQLLEAAKNGDIDVVKVYSLSHFLIFQLSLTLSLSLSLSLSLGLSAEALYSEERQLPGHAGSVLHSAPLCRWLQPSRGGGVLAPAERRRHRQGQGVGSLVQMHKCTYVVSSFNSSCNTCSVCVFVLSCTPV